MNEFLIQLCRVLSLGDYNTRVVVLGTACLGLAAGVIGTFAYLRGRAMMGDALSHATLPGIALAFLLLGGKSFGGLLAGAAVSGTLGVLAVLGLRRMSRIHEDAAIGIVLSVFFAAGMAALSVIQKMQSGDQAGLSRFIYGSAAAMIRRDAWLIAGCAALVMAASMFLYKEFKLVCFDQNYAAAQGKPVLLIDVVMMALVVLTTVIGLQAVGLILVIAMLIIPAAAARFWTDRLWLMVLIAGAVGALSGWLGATLSALAERMPAGAVIVLVAGVLFALSMILSPHRGLLAEGLRRRGLRRRIEQQNLLRALVEFEESAGDTVIVEMNRLLAARGWSPRALHKTIGRAAVRGDVALLPDGRVRLSDAGRAAARRLLRNHRLWEMYLIRYADIAPSHVDRDADEVEHVLGPAIIHELEQALEDAARIPPSPHVQEAIA